MSKSNATEADLIAFIFNQTAIPWAANANFYVALHTADPGEAGDQTTSEAAYTSYARVAVSRDIAGWTIAGALRANAAEVPFPPSTGAPEPIPHVSIGLAASGASQIIYSGILNAPLAVANLITPRIIAGALDVTED